MFILVLLLVLFLDNHSIRTAPVDVYPQRIIEDNDVLASIRTAPVDVYLIIRQHWNSSYRSIRTAPVDVYP